MSNRGWVANIRRKYLHLQAGGTLRVEDLAFIAECAERAADRIDELEAMLASNHSMLQEVARAAGFHTGEQYSAASIIARLRDRDR